MNSNGNAQDGFVWPRAPGGQVILCEECMRRGGCRLGITKEALAGDYRTETELQCPKDHEGGPGVAHGGWIASALDEVLGHLPLLCGQMTVTAKLTVEFLRPAPIERPLRIVAWRDRIDGNRWMIEGELRLVSNDALLARAEGAFAERDRERHFKRFDDWIAKEGNAASE